MTTKTTARTYVRRFEKLLVDPITSDEYVTAEGWYVEAGMHAQELARRLESTPEVGASILSAFSIRTKWEANKQDAYSYAEGFRPAGLEIRNVLADAALVHGFGAFKAPKTHAFARAIAGDTDAVVVDVWMCRAAGLDREAPSIVQYRNIAKAITTLAKRHNMTPRGMQALIWGRVRGSMV